MKPQEFQFGDQPWPPDQGVLQVYAPVDLAANPELAVLISKCREAVESSPSGGKGAPVTRVDDQHLHVTLDVLAGRVERDVPQAERDQLVDALRQRLTDVPAYHGSAGSCLAYASGVVVDISPATPLVAMQKAVREVIRDVCGESACTWSQSKPHISTHYCREAADSDPWARKLRQIDPNHAPLSITSVALVDVRPDNLTKRLEWTAVTPPIPLAGADRR